MTTSIGTVFLVLIVSIFAYDDLLDSPIFDVRPESKSLQEIKSNLEVLKGKYQQTMSDQNNVEIKEDKKERKDKNFKKVQEILSRFLSTLKRNRRKAVKDKSDNKDHGTKTIWHKWTDWSTCSVSCGKGRVIRWRHCKENCQEVETEMEEMSCQLPECPRKLFGLIKLN